MRQANIIIPLSKKCKSICNQLCVLLITSDFSVVVSVFSLKLVVLKMSQREADTELTHRSSTYLGELAGWLAGWLSLPFLRFFLAMPLLFLPL